MKKIDLHIHTVASVSDKDFCFNLDKLKEYVSEAKLDAIAITNHDVFDGAQFRLIVEALEVTVFPGIEVTLECGHILVISDTTDLEDFESKAGRVSEKITSQRDRISIEDFEAIFFEPSRYLVIPHYDKKPSIKGEDLIRIESYVSAGEVDSAKKFIRAIKDDSKLTPVFFSDVRISDKLEKLPTRHTFVDCGELTLNAIKSCLRDKAKVALSPDDGNKLFQVFDDGQMISTGLNVFLGGRSTGKTYTLNKIAESQENVKYIRQFSLVQQDEEAYEREFKKELKRTRSQFVEDYLSGFKVVLNDIINVELHTDERRIENYVGTLLKSAEEADRRDAFSKTELFHESEFAISEDPVLNQLIGSVRQLIENIEFRGIIEKHVDIGALKRLACELIELARQKALDRKKRTMVNALLQDIKSSLKMRTASVQIEDVDLYRVSINRKKVDRFSAIAKCLQKESIISEERIQGFCVIAKKAAFTGAGQIRAASHSKVAFADSFREYEDPYSYLQTLIDNESLTPSEFYKFFTRVTYTILNKDGFEVSGGERSEFRLLQQIKDAQNYDILLIDEPESSFDNMFLKSDVNQLIREISKSMPVVVVTHNSTVGASIGADYVLYTSKVIEDSQVVYKLYSGYPTDRKLVSRDRTSTSNYEIMLNSLEAGFDTYEARRGRYEAVKD